MTHYAAVFFLAAMICAVLWMTQLVTGSAVKVTQILELAFLIVALVMQVFPLVRKTA